MLNLEDKLIDSANYLADILEIPFQRCHKFARKHAESTKE